QAVAGGGVPDDLVHRVVAADVLADAQQVAVGGGDRGGVQAAGALEQLLCGAQPVGQRGQHTGGEAHVVVGHGEAAAGAHRLQAGLAAHPARGGGGEAAPCRDVGRRHAGSQDDVDDVVGVDAVLGGARAVAQGVDVGGVGDEALADEEPGDHLEVVAGGAHGDGQRASADAHL